IGPNITIHGGSGSVGYNAGLSQNANVTVINQGTILADSAGTITVNGANWVNQNMIQGSNGGNLTLGGSWSNSATGNIGITGGGSLTTAGSWSNSGVMSESNSTINFGGSFSVSQMGTFNRSGGTVNLTGTLNNAA